MAMTAMDANTGQFTVYLPTAPGPSQTQPQQVFIVTSPQNSPTPLSKANARKFCAMGCTQLILGILEIVFNIGEQFAWSNMGSSWPSPSYFVGAGYWCGVPAIITGCFGIAAGMKKGKCFIITFLVLSVITCVITTGIIIVSAVSISMLKDGSYYYYDYRYDWYVENTTAPSYAWNSLMLIAGILEFVIAIISSAIACKSLAGNGQHNTVTTGVLQSGQQSYPGSQVTTGVLQSGQQPYPGGQVGAPMMMPPPPYQSQEPGQEKPN